MAAKANIRQVGDVLIVDLSGRIALGDGSGAPALETVKDMLKDGQKNILLNLGDVTYIDSAGLGEMVGAYATVTNQGGHIKLLNVQKKVHDLLQVTKPATPCSNRLPMKVRPYEASLENQQRPSSSRIRFTKCACRGMITMPRARVICPPLKGAADFLEPARVSSSIAARHADPLPWAAILRPQRTPSLL